MHNCYDDNFEAGKLMVALNKKINYIHAAEYYKNITWNGLDCEKIETIFHPQETENEYNIEDVILIHLKRKDKQAVKEAIERLLSNPDVVYAEPDYLNELHIIPNDPLFRNLWGMERIQAPLAWNCTIGSHHVIVGVLDTGAESTHPDLRANLLIPRENRFRDIRDLSGHGTHVAGTVGAIGNNRIGVAGVCWRVGLAIFKIGNNSIDLASAIAAIDFAAKNNVPILNNSWGGRQPSSILRFAIEQYNGLFIASAGNNGTNNDANPVYPASYTANNIISVAAINPDNALATFSNFGVKSVDIAAPGTGILSANLRGSYSNMNGTSMAAPHVAGAAALLKAFRPRLTTRDIRNIILSTATRTPSLNGRVATGGVLNVKAMLERVASVAI